MKNLSNIDIFNLSPIFNNGELAEEREAKKCKVCGCLFAYDDDFCSDDCADEFERERKFEEDIHFAEDYNENQND